MRRRKTQGKRKYHRGRRQKKGLIDHIMNLMLVIAVIVFAVAAIQLIRIGKGYWDGRSEYKKVIDLAIENPTEEDGFRVDFDKLREINEDTIAWIRFYPEPEIISYPVVQGVDNEQYLHQTFSANENTLGAIFMNVNNRADFSDENTIIYGHRMKDGSMFRKLAEYESKEFWEENPYFYIYTVDGRELTYRIYSVGQVEDTSDTYLTSFVDEEAYEDYITLTKKVSLYDTGVEVTTGDRVVTLSTCTAASDTHRFVVRGVLEKERKMGD